MGSYGYIDLIVLAARLKGEKASETEMPGFEMSYHCEGDASP